MTSRAAVYAFSGDPITYGHLDIIQRARSLFPKLIVAIGTNPDKTYTFSAAERERLAKQALAHLSGVSVRRFEGLLVDFAYEQGAQAIVKGVRNAQDFQYEQTLNSMGLSQNYGLETVLLFAKPELAHVSSSTVKQLQKSQGLVQEYVPPAVKVTLEKKLSNQVIVGLTGEIASGKTTLAQRLTAIGRERGIEVHNLELDTLAHQIQDSLAEPPYRAIREQIVAEFGEAVQNQNGSINRHKLGEIVFADPQKLARLNQLMWKPVLVRLRRELIGKQGLILITSALLAEADLLTLCNNRIILTEVNAKTQSQRLKERGLTAAQIRRRLQSQFSAEKKRHLIEASLQKHHFGTLWQVTDQADATAFAEELFQELL